MTAHWQYFFDVIKRPNVFANYKTVRSQLTPFNVQHINIKRKTQAFKLQTRTQYA